MKTQNTNEIEITKGVVSGFFTKWSLFLKEGGVRYHIDQVLKDMNNSKVIGLNIRNSNTGASQIKLISELRKDFFFQK